MVAGELLCRFVGRFNFWVHMDCKIERNARVRLGKNALKKFLPISWAIRLAYLTKEVLILWLHYMEQA